MGGRARYARVFWMTAPDPEGSGIRPVGVFQFNTPTRSLFYINFRINNVRSRAPLSLKAEAPTIFLWAGGHKQQKLKHVGTSRSE